MNEPSQSLHHKMKTQIVLFGLEACTTDKPNTKDWCWLWYILAC